MNINIEDLEGHQAKTILQDIVEKLDELDGEDFFGTEGWRVFLGLED
jgi:hypothetical protein